ncbi:hypothetical protein MWU59_10945 [Flavobacteriaceae bacterium F08102]|nr:hypothetical protein [Flavobacteriaceae bacterium F08102]
MKTTIIMYTIFSLGLLSFTALNPISEDKYIGDWEMVVEETPEGDISLTMTITLDDEQVYSGELTTSEGNYSLENLSIKEGNLLAYFVYQDGDFELSGTFDENEFTGEIYGMDMTFTTNGKKVEE